MVSGRRRESKRDRQSSLSRRHNSRREAPTRNWYHDWRDFRGGTVGPGEIKTRVFDDSVMTCID